MKEWKTKMEIQPCQDTEDPRLFNFDFTRIGGRRGYTTWSATFREDELKELEKIIHTSLSKVNQE